MGLVIQTHLKHTLKHFSWLKLEDFEMTAVPQSDPTHTLWRLPHISIMKTQKPIVWLADKPSMWWTHKPTPPAEMSLHPAVACCCSTQIRWGFSLLKFIDSVSAFLSELHWYKYTLIKIRRIKLPIATHGEEKESDNNMLPCSEAVSRWVMDLGD